MRILMLMMETGHGHKMPALAVKQALQELDGTAEVRVLDFAKDLGSEKLDRRYKKAWDLLMEKPRLLDVMYRITSSRLVQIQRLEAMVSRRLSRRLLDFIDDYRPDLIFSTHFTPANIISRLKKRGKISVPDAVLITDMFIYHPLWGHGHNDYYICFNERYFQFLKNKGVDDSRMIKRHFPLRKQFEAGERDREALRVRLDLDRDRLLAVLVIGGEGKGNLVETVERYAREDLDMTLIAVCGTNEEARTQLVRIKAEGMKLIVKGYVENIHEYLMAADLAIGKAGTSFAFENMVLHNPVMITTALANEKGTKDFIVENGMGWYAPTVERQVVLLKKMIKNPGYLQGYRDACRRMNILNGSREIAEFLLSIVRAKAA